MKVKIGNYTGANSNFLKLYYQLRYLKYPWEINHNDILDDIVESVYYFTVKIYEKFFSKKDRKVSVKIDSHDIYSLDHTLALVVHPALVEFRKSVQGYPIVHDKDVPKHLRTSNKSNHHQNSHAISIEEDNAEFIKWKWVLDEMIWSFYQILDDSEEDQYYHNRDNLDISFKKIEGSDNSQMVFNYQKDNTMPKYHIDRKGLDKYHKRIENGLILFGKYYRHLWS